MRVVFDSFQSYIMETLQPQILTQTMPSVDSASSAVGPTHSDPSTSQNNLDVLLTAAISANPNSHSPSMHNPPDHLSLHTRIPNATAPMSIQSLLAGSEHNAQQHSSQQQPHSPQSHQPQQHQHHASWSQGQFLSSQLAKGKRKHDGSEGEDPRSKIRRTVRDHLVLDSARLVSMTTVVCLHAAVAQKSYGSEKRFLCPPPIVRIEGLNQHMNSQQLSMCIVSEDGLRSPPQKAALDGNMQAAFKHLHVAGTAKQKNFHLALDIANPPPPPASDPHDMSGKIWASFESAPVTIISKPSKKTAKTRNISSCILPGGPVSLFNRINSQTVRTKYLTIDHGSLCASNVSWSAFNVNVVHRPPEPPSNLTGPQPVTYGSQIILTDALSGISTGSLIIRKVDKGKVALEDGGPVSQMQKIALQRANPDGTRQYLSAVGPITVGGAVVAPPAPGASTQGGTHTLLFQSPRVRDEVKDGQRVITDEVDDYLCWTIVGISKFQYTFFDALGKTPATPAIPLTPFPTLFTTPVYRSNTNTLELTVSNFYCPSIDGKNLQPLEVWLGSLGPLNQRVFQATLPGPLTSVTSFGHSQAQSSNRNTGIGIRASSSPTEHNAVQSAISPTSSHLDRELHTSTATPTLPRQNSALGPLHSIVVLDMPPVEQVVKAIQESIDPAVASTDVKDRIHQRSPAEGTELGTEMPPHHVTDGPSSDTTTHKEITQGSSPSSSTHYATQQQNPSSSSGPTNTINGRSLPLLFIRPADGMGYHSGRSIVCENLIQNLTMNALTNGPGGNVDPSWIAAAQAAASADGGFTAAWNLRVI